MKFSTAVAALPVAASLAAAVPMTKRSGGLDGKSVIAYWGQEDKTKDGNSVRDLSELCNDEGVDMVMISFLTHLTKAEMNLGSHTGGASEAQKKAGYDGLVDGDFVWGQSKGAAVKAGLKTPALADSKASTNDANVAVNDADDGADIPAAVSSSSTKKITKTKAASSSTKGSTSDIKKSVANGKAAVKKKVAASDSASLIVAPTAPRVDTGVASDWTTNVKRDGKSISAEIKECQKNGKKILISMGGDATVSNVKFSNDDDAKKAANEVWNLLFAGNDEKVVPKAVRPFGDAVLDGLDIDNESHVGTSYEAFVSTLRGLMDQDKKRQYLLGGSPQIGDDKISNDNKQSVPSGVFKYLDFVNVQLYNAGSGTGTWADSDDVFVKTVQRWQSYIKNKSKNTKLVLGMAAPGGVASQLGTPGKASDFENKIKKLKDAKVDIGGAAIWSGGYAMSNGNFQRVIKQAL